jgi:SAM-dependent methyltransferase
MFVSAALLFVVQPMVAKLLLPHLGGSSAVWTTCMLFFQAALLAGYGYAHLGARFLSPRKQAAAHVPLMLIAFVSLPIALPEIGLDASQTPVSWLLVALVLAVGLPFFVVSTSAPLLQHWFAHTGHETADDPYHLYAASNLGSMTSLLGYPFLIEPFLGVRTQTIVWTVVYGLFVALTIACAWKIRDVRQTRASKATSAEEAPPLSWKKRLYWVTYAFVPSSMMLAVTQYLTTDIAAVPLLWVLPLAIYLLTFILVFASRPFWLPEWFRIGLPLFAIGVMIATAYKVPMWIGILAHLASFFLFAMFFHGALAKDRPHPSHLTEFFLLLSVGGALGGVFNGVIAPVVFDRALDYYLIVVVAVALIVPAKWRIENPHGNPWLIPTLLVPVAGFYLYAMDFWALKDPLTVVFTVFILAPIYLFSVWRPRLENAGLAMVIALGAASYMDTPGIITYERSFFAAYKVYERDYSRAGRFRKFSHGTTTHGAQSLDPDKETTPVSYHHPEGPVGQILERIPHEEVLVVGLGAGAMTSYAKPGTHFDIFEIDPLVYAIAQEHFTYLDHCGDRCTVTIGDGRRLIEEADKKWDIIFLDAYNSDAVPTHLLTREALDLYLEKLAPDGVIVFHVSNRYLDIEGVVGGIVKDAGLVARTQLHIPPKRERREKQIDASKYTVVARELDDFHAIKDEERWREVEPADIVWTDDFTNIITVFEWD